MRAFGRLPTFFEAIGMMHSPLIVQQSSKQAIQTDLVGAKAARLAVLSQAGFNVPDFFVITTHACEEFFRPRYHGNDQVHLSQSGRALVSKNLDALLSANGHSPFSVAARSSAPFEDQARFSLAGQFDTILNIQSIDALWSAAGQCWKSLEKPNVQAYFRQFGFAPNRRRMAVLVQRMVDAEMAGVIFTQHPVTNDNSSLLIEIVEGYGDALVSGQIEPMRLLVERKSIKIACLPFAGKKDIKADLLTVHQGILRKLIDAALQIEQIFGCPQDIEWAIEEGRIWILQARPITHPVSRARNYLDAQGLLWTDYFFVERFAKPLSPLGWSLLQNWVEKNAFREPLWYLGNDALLRQKHLTRSVGGFPFTNLAVFQRLYALVPLDFISEDKKISLLLQVQRQSWWREMLVSLPYLLSRMLPKDLNWLPGLHLRFWRKFTRELETVLPALLKEIRPALTPANLLVLLNRMESLSGRLLALHRWSITFADVFFVLLSKLIKHWLPQAPETLIADLLTGLEGNNTVETNLALAELAEKTATDPKHTPQRLQTFLTRYGHRSESLDIAEPCWREVPDTVMRLAAHIFEKKKCEQVKADYWNSVQKRQVSEDFCYEQLQRAGFMLGYFRRRIFSRILWYAQEFTLLRENQRNEWHKILFVTRQAVLRLGELLANRGRIPQANDVFLLTREELLAQDGMLTGEALPYEQILTRRKEWEQLLKSEQRAPHESSTPLQRKGGPGSRGRLEGLGVSKGLARGRARLAFNLQEASQAKAGEILVAHSADPAWTPMFGLLSGLVLEVGGVLSHASIVAREFGLPAVTSVAKATRFIQNGDLIQLDGEKGTVEILQ